MELEAEELERLVADVVRKVGNFVEAKMRAFYLASRLDEMEEELALEVMHAICERASDREPAYQRAVLALVDTETLTDVLGFQKVRRLYIESHNRGYASVKRILSRAQPAKRYEGENELFIQYGLHTKLTGERKNLARRAGPAIIDRLTYDLDPLVVRDLLKNPRLTEQHVVKMAARRPNRPEILEEIFKNPKWIARYQVKLALARNPYTPPRIAAGLLVFLTEHDINEVANHASLHEEVRQQARKLLRSKGLELERREDYRPKKRGFTMYHIDLENAVVKPMDELDEEPDEF